MHDLTIPFIFIYFSYFIYLMTQSVTRSNIASDGRMVFNELEIM
jgi:hypothetical protein